MKAKVAFSYRHFDNSILCSCNLYFRSKTSHCPNTLGILQIPKYSHFSFRKVHTISFHPPATTTIIGNTLLIHQTPAGDRWERTITTDSIFNPRSPLGSHSPTRTPIYSYPPQSTTNAAVQKVRLTQSTLQETREKKETRTAETSQTRKKKKTKEEFLKFLEIHSWATKHNCIRNVMSLLICNLHS